jgi:hypothetical protein
MRAFFAQSLPHNPWLLGAFIGVLILFAAVLTISLAPWRSRELDEASRLPLND